MMQPDSVDRYLDLAWQAVTPEPELRERVRAKLGSGGMLPLAAVERSGSVARMSRFRALRASGKLGAALGIGVFALGVVVGLSVPDGLREPQLRAPEARPVVLHGAQPAATPNAAARSEAVQGIPSASIEATPVIAPAAVEPRRPSLPRSAKQERDWRGELALLERAEKAIRSDNAAFALALLAEFDRRYPRSRLLEERQAIELMAHCQARATDAAKRAERFRRAHPNSVYAQRIAEACERSSSGLTDKPEAGGH